MKTVPVHGFFFDHAATLAMGVAFDQACKSLPDLEHLEIARETIAKAIITAAQNGELDPTRLCEQALKGLQTDRSAMSPNLGKASVCSIAA